MFLIVGLGNPGKKFKHTRHNLGFEVINELAREENFPQSKSLGKSLISRNKINEKEVILAKPQTYMNKSGTAVRQLLDRFSLKSDDLVVIHDDLDLLLGNLKVSQDRGAGGHNGVQSVINELQTKNFIRIRLGIGHEHGTPDRKRFVLGKFQQSERKAVERMKQEAVEALKTIVRKGAKQAMNQYNK